MFLTFFITKTDTFINQKYFRETTFYIKHFPLNKYNLRLKILNNSSSILETRKFIGIFINIYWFEEVHQWRANWWVFIDSKNSSNSLLCVLEQKNFSFRLHWTQISLETDSEQCKCLEKIKSGVFRQSLYPESISLNDPLSFSNGRAVETL